MPPPLHGVRILDLSTGIAGPYAARLMADYGAEVIAVRPPAARLRAAQLAPLDLDLTLGKRAITLDVTQAAGRALLLQLVRSADAMVESFRPGVLDAWRLSYDDLLPQRSDLVLLSITPFGQTGPYRNDDATEIMLAAMGSEMYATGSPAREPLSLPAGLSLRYAGLTAAAVLAAVLLGRQRTGRGEHIDVAIFEVLAASIDRRADGLVSYAYCGEKTLRASPEESTFPRPYNRCRDGYVALLVPVSHWTRFAGIIDAPWMSAAGITGVGKDPELRRRAAAHWDAWCSSRSKEEITLVMQRAGIACAPVNRMREIDGDRHLRQRGFFREVLHADRGAVRYAGPPFKLAPCCGVAPRAVQSASQDNAAVYGELGLSADELHSLQSQGVV